MGQKRRRLALSCVGCRRRKVKCDRTYPTCIRCQKGGVTCDYVSYTSKNGEGLPTPDDESPHLRREASVASWTEQAHVWHSRAKERDNQARTQEDPVNTSTSHSKNLPTPKPLQELQERVLELETHVRTAGSRLTPSLQLPSERLLPAIPVGAPAEQDFERALLKGRSFKTQYFGPSHAASILLQFEELSAFVVDILHRLPTLEKARKDWKQYRRNITSSIVLPEHDTLLTLIPDQATTDSLVQLYFEVLETTYRVLHAPTFFRQYKEFWAPTPPEVAEDSESTSSETSTVFLVQLLLVCASANAVAQTKIPAYTGPSSVERDNAIKWIEVCETWLDLQSQKHMSLETFQVQILIPIAKRLNCVKIKRTWTVAGHLLRLAMSAGLHREPTFLSKKISVFDQEMRRRLWFTIVELELQASLDKGMCASIGPFDFDCLPPMNLHDEDFDQSTEKLPPPRPITEFTRTSFLCLAQKHLPLRLELVSRLNSVRPYIEDDAAIELDRRIRKYLDDIPQWPDTAAKIASQPLSGLVLYEFLLQIHQPVVAETDAQARHFFSRVARQNAALSIAKIYAEMRPNAAMLFVSLREDLFRALLGICVITIVEMISKEYLAQDTTAVVKLIGQGVDIMENRIRQLGQGFHPFWLTSSALALLQAKISTDKSPDVHAQETADRVARLHRKMMEYQKASIHPLDGVDATINNTANTLLGMSGQQAAPMPEVDPFGPIEGQFNAFSDTLFDFDMTDIWGMSNYGQYQ
ncbi:hypothetical protein LTR10_020000 [Elasticomyces elasticus]|uniref:Zn(2)-C6 fungal-type domain-containing protein n=1 Tax=Exophiala sideris TaxID=1016849 RepID=A0ABR0IYC1_9EURO|nr:hypothetical protein LTR10_020000 [Elasticomyces elasticus]KAK5022465.1 hypothetical protein LTS07_010125 [Exophiala sideris]KAK5027175.1 hypothetical protein LTR13_009570 [Exophiala sideris]KAK5051319.1 hypothetical protein LTR69_010345 [Exophiala sideris]KAK5177715.1 hypothetical protein LTR44_009690 [Eurotiomycetes sp. CCFEE 6388]